MAYSTVALQKLEAVQSWMGRTVETNDVVTVSPLLRMSAWLDREDPQPKSGDAVPPGWHLLYFLIATLQRDLGQEGGTPRNDIQPPNPFQRAMWIGCRNRFYAPLRVGESIRRVGTLKSVTAKEGRSGPMVFLTIHDDFFNSQGLALTEEMDLVYRDCVEGEVAPQPQPRPVEPVWKRTLKADPPFLFLFSALTYNSHRIHYDYPYTTKTEGYPGLLVAGPLQALLLLDLARRHGEGQVVEFSCRAQRPLFQGSEFSAEGAPTPDGKGATLWTCDAAGVGMIASVTRA